MTPMPSPSKDVGSGRVQATRPPHVWSTITPYSIQLITLWSKSHLRAQMASAWGRFIASWMVLQCIMRLASGFHKDKHLKVWLIAKAWHPNDSNVGVYAAKCHFLQKSNQTLPWHTVNELVKNRFACHVREEMRGWGKCMGSKRSNTEWHSWTPLSSAAWNIAVVFPHGHEGSSARWHSDVSSLSLLRTVGNAVALDDACHQRGGKATK